jgi:hypothetical protein
VDPETGKLARKPGSEVELVTGAVSGLGVREWLASAGRLQVAGAAFDTRLQGLSAFTGRASKSIRRLLARHGARITASPESFLVQDLTGALAEGELGRARAWGQRLTEVTASQAPPGAARPPDAVGCQQRDGAGTPWSRQRARRL